MEDHDNISLNVKINIVEILADIVTEIKFENVFTSLLKTFVIILLSYSTHTKLNVKHNILKTYGIIVYPRQIGISLIGFI